MEIINLIILVVLGLFYIYFFAKIQNAFFQKLSQPKKNSAVLIVFISSLVAASINLVHISDITNDAIRFFLKGGKFMEAILYAVSFFAGMWIFSLLLFRFSYLFVGLLSPEKEDDELQKNNIELAIIHAVILISLTFVIAPPLVKIAAEFIPYPKLPF